MEKKEGACEAVFATARVDTGVALVAQGKPSSAVLRGGGHPHQLRTLAISPTTGLTGPEEK